MNENNNCCNNKIELDDLEVLFPNAEKYEKEDKEMLLAILKDRDNLIKNLWFELKAAREQEELLKKHINEMMH